MAGPGGSAASEPPESARAEPIRLSTSFADAAAIPIEAPVSVSASGGSLDSVTRQLGCRRRRTRSFRTVDLTLQEQTFASIAPLNGETVGVGIPVVVTFDLPVTDRALFEKHMEVTRTPAQRGSW